MNGNRGSPRSWSDLSSTSSGCPASGQWVGPFDKSFKEGTERGRVEGEPEDKSGVVLQGLIMRAPGVGFLDVVFVLERVAPGRCCK